MSVAPSTVHAALAELLERWITISLEARRRQVTLSGREFFPGEETALEQEVLAAADRARPYLKYFLEDNSARSAEQLVELAANLSPGSRHNGGLLVGLVHGTLPSADPLLVAATIWYNWHGGKVGSQFLPNIREVGVEAYCDDRDELLLLFYRAYRDPRRILTGEDRAFYDSLPERFTVYRGCPGLSPEDASEGISWTTRRPIAEWFASGDVRQPPTPVGARIRKEWVRLAKASEHEVVVLPRHWRPLKCPKRPETWRPEMTWRSS
jgi:hypothetical protein